MFSRKRGGPKHVRAGRRAARRRRSPKSLAADGEPPAPERGPYDAQHAPDGVQRLDLGSLQIPAVDGVEVRVQANPEGGVEQIVLVHGDSALQLGVFAAPRSRGHLGRGARRDRRGDDRRRRRPARDPTGPYGIELAARVNTPEGPADVRFVGVDGPRWMVRALYQGAAAADPAREGALGGCLSGLVVVRDDEARPVREPLPLRLPKEMAEQAQAAQDEHGASKPGRPLGRQPACMAGIATGDGVIGGRSGVPCMGGTRCTLCRPSPAGRWKGGTRS